MTNLESWRLCQPVLLKIYPAKMMMAAERLLGYRHICRFIARIGNEDRQTDLFASLLSADGAQHSGFATIGR